MHKSPNYVNRYISTTINDQGSWPPRWTGNTPYSLPRSLKNVPQLTCGNETNENICMWKRNILLLLLLNAHFIHQRKSEIFDFDITFFKGPENWPHASSICLLPLWNLVHPQPAMWLASLSVLHHHDCVKHALSTPCVQIWPKKSKRKCLKWSIVICRVLCYKVV